MEIKMKVSRKTAYRVGANVATELQFSASDDETNKPLQEDVQNGTLSVTWVGSSEVTDFGLGDVVSINVSKSSAQPSVATRSASAQ
jgi:hypothetical protein